MANIFITKKIKVKFRKFVTETVVQIELAPEKFTIPPNELPLLLTSNFYGLEGQKVCFKQRPIQDKIVLSPLIVKAKIKSKFQSTSFTEVNVKINKVYKDHSEKIIKKPNFIRLRFACQPHIRSDFSINLTDSIDSDLSLESG